VEELSAGYLHSKGRKAYRGSTDVSEEEGRTNLYESGGGGRGRQRARKA